MNFKRLIIFFLSFILGLFIVFLFSIILSSSGGSLEIKAKYLNLTLAGALGGLLYDIVLKGSLQLPERNDNGQFKAGFLGDIFIGISGGFIAYVLLPDNLKYSDQEFNNIFSFVTGLVGGYGCKAILNASLRRVIKNVQEAEEEARQNYEEARQKVQEAENQLLAIFEDKGTAILWKVNNQQIQKYQEETRIRAMVSFEVALRVMVVGFIFLIVGTVIIITNIDDFNKTIAGGLISTIGGTLSAFITKTFMDIHRVSITQSNKYFEQPVINDHILMADRIAKQIKKDEDRKIAYIKIIDSISTLIAQNSQTKDK